MRERCMMKRFHVIIASSMLALFFLLSSSMKRSQQSTAKCKHCPLSHRTLGVVGIIGAIAFLAGLRQPDTTYGNAHFATPQEFNTAVLLQSKRV